MLPYPWDHTPLCLAHGAAMNSTTKWKTVNVCTHTLSSSSSFAYTGKQVVYVDKCQRRMNLAVCQFQLHFKVHKKNRCRDKPYARVCQTPWFTQHRNVEREKKFVVTLSLKQKSPSDISRPKHRYGWHYQILVACYRIIATKWDKATICYKCYFRLTNTRAFEINCLFFLVLFC